MPRVNTAMVTSALELPGYRIVRNYGIVRGIIVRSRSVIGNLGAALQTIVGGNITILTDLCEKTREDAFELMLQHALEHGANAVVCMRYDATEVMQGVTRSAGLWNRSPRRTHRISRANSNAFCGGYLVAGSNRQTTPVMIPFVK